MLEENPKIGEVDPKLWIALEDLQYGWLKSGTVGQEVYGAGNAFGILPRHYLQVPGEEFMIYVDYPTAGFNSKKGQNIHFSLLGDERMNCRMMAFKTGSAKLPDFEVSGSGLHEPLTGTVVKEGNIDTFLVETSELPSAGENHRSKLFNSAGYTRLTLLLKIFFC